MRTFLKYMSLILMAALLLPLAAGAENGRLTADELIADSAILVDAYTGEVLFEKDADKRRYPASTTKIMTLILSIERGNGEQIVTVPKECGEISLDSTRVPVYWGEKMPLKDLWHGLIYNSGNDAANAIAVLTSGSLSAFAADMNGKAAELGMTNTHYVNAHGLHDPEHYTTARDMAKLAVYCMDNDLFREITLSTSYVMQPTSLRGELPIDHHYGITDFTSRYYYPYAMGIKTGYTAKAGQCFVGAAAKDGHELIAVVLHSGFVKEYKWQDTKKLFEYGFELLEGREGN